MKKIVVSKPTFNALTETNPNNLIFSSDYNTLKYHSSGSLSINVSQSANTFYSLSTFVTHGLGYLPFVVVFGFQPKTQAGYSPLGITYSWTDDGIGETWFRHLRFWITSNRIYAGVEGLRTAAGESYTATFYYKIYRNRLGI